MKINTGNKQIFLWDFSIAISYFYLNMTKGRCLSKERTKKENKYSTAIRNQSR